MDRFTFGTLYLRDGSSWSRGHGPLRPGRNILQHRAAGEDRSVLGPEEPASHAEGLEGVLLAMLRGSGSASASGCCPAECRPLLPYELCRREKSLQAPGGRYRAVEGGGSGTATCRYCGRLRPPADSGHPTNSVLALLLAALCSWRDAGLCFLKWPHVFWGVIASMYIGTSCSSS